MTIAQAVQRVIDTAANEVGYLEKKSNSQLDSKTANAGAGNWTKYARDIDALGVTWGNKNGYAWCAEYVLWVFNSVFGIELALKILCSPNPTGIPLCSYGAGYFQKEGQWFKNPQIPQPGDIIFFYSGGDINHTGIVEFVSGGQVHTIEGNSSNSVARRSYSLSDTNRIAGFGRPRYELAENVTIDGDALVIPFTEESQDRTPEEYQYGDKGEAVTMIQSILAYLGYDLGPDGVDGEIGFYTDIAIRQFQEANDLKVDGIVGEKTMAKLEEYAKKYEQEKKNPVVASGNVYEIDPSQSTVNVDISTLFASNKKEFKVGDVVLFVGNTQYISANAAAGKPCTNGVARITRIYQLGRSKHPYHLVRISGSRSNVNGWVDVGSFRNTQN